MQTVADILWDAGNFSNGSERLIAVGHDNGDLRLFDLAAGKYVWKTNVGAGVRCKSKQLIKAAAQFSHYLSSK